MPPPYEVSQFIHDIDDNPRLMTTEERTELTAPKNGGKGDWFAQLLERTPVTDRLPLYSFRGFLSSGTLPGSSYQAFAVADGIPIIYDHDNPENLLNTVNRRLRFLVVALPDSTKTRVDLSRALLERTLFIVGHSNVAGRNDREAYLQCASWDPDAVAKGSGLFRFYQRGSDGWVYFGNSFNAFNRRSVSHGPFEGHVGGALIMKELTRPWPHWYTQSNMAAFKDSLGSTREEASKCDPHNALYNGLFTTQHGHPFNKLGTAETLEPIIRASVLKWYNTRFYSDFVATSQADGTRNANAIKSWVSHILLSNGTNIAASETSAAQIEQKVDVGAPPITLFINLNALQAVLPDVGKETGWDFTIKNDVYKEAVKELKLSLYHEDGAVAVNLTEGPFAFPIIEPGIEDYQAVSVLATNSVKLVPKKAIAAMLMIDFWNPMYSVKRAKLMTYLPDTATFEPATKTYDDFFSQFIINLSQSPHSITPDTPEFDFLNLLGSDEWETKFADRVNNYLHAVQARLEGDAQKAAVKDYMVLAEGRRRLYKGWQNRLCGSGLDEFQMTLPIAARPDPFPLVEMSESGNLTDIDFTPTVERSQQRVGRAGKLGCPAHG